MHHIKISHLSYSYIVAKIEIKDVLETLSRERPIFHSEMDFQFALAWKIKSLYPEVEVRLEKPLMGAINSTEHIDIFLINSEINIGIELKYIKAGFSVQMGRDSYTMKTHGANDIRCFDVLKDIQRLENFKKNKDISAGYSIVLTNVVSLWKPKRSKKENFYDEFRIYDGRIAKGTINWKPGTGEGTKKYHPGPIKLAGKYTFNWVDYSVVGLSVPPESIKRNLFRYVIVKI